MASQTVAAGHANGSIIWLDHLTADKAYGSKADRRSLRARRIPHTIPERDDVRRSRARKGSRGGRPPNFNAERYKDRNQVERAFNRLKQFRAVATRHDKLKTVTTPQ